MTEASCTNAIGAPYPTACWKDPAFGPGARAITFRFVASVTVAEKSAAHRLVRRRRAEIFAVPGASEELRVTTAEDILLAKLRWYRLGDEQSVTQPHDIRQIIALNHSELDWPYIERWAGRLGVSDLLSRFRA